MRRIGLVLALAACGRVGFSAEGAPTGDALDTGDAPAGGEQPAPAMCNSRLITTLPLTESVHRVRATAVSGIGYAIAFETDSAIHVAKLDGSKELVSFHTPFSRYILHGIGTIDQFVFVSMDPPGGSEAYLKRLVPGWDSYETPVTGQTATFDPPVAGRPGRAKAWAGVRVGGVIYIDEIDRDGAQTGVVSEYQPPAAVHASFSPSGDDVRAALDRGDGTCETFLLAIDGAVRDRRVLDECMEPRAVGFPDGSAAILFRAPASHDVHWLPPGAGTPVPALSLGDSPEARITPFDGPHVLAAHPRAGSGLALARYGPDGVSNGSFPEGQAPFDLLPDALFWMVGSDLHVAEPCLR